MKVSLFTGAVLLFSSGPSCVSAQQQEESSPGPAPSSPPSRLRVRLNPSNLEPLDEPDYGLWAIGEEESASTTIDGVSFSLAAAANSTLAGGSYKHQFERPLAPLGERVVNQGISTDPDDEGDQPIVLSIGGLPEGKHTLLAWHNAWDNLDEVASLSVAVNGEVVEELSQSIRVDNIWEAAASYLHFNVPGHNETTQFEFRPSGADGRAFLNGLEIDTPDRNHAIAFPEPHNRDERVQLDGGDTWEASWRAADVDSSLYNVYLGRSPDEMESVSMGQEGTSAMFSGLNTFDMFWWRVDVVAGGETYVGHPFMFRGAQLAFPGAEGYGQFARGGRGGRVIHVTSLQDSEEEGTLRHAVSVATGPRYVVFDVGGVITLASRLSVTDSHLTLAGQTAPGKGIIVQGHPFGLSGASDVIFRHIRIRPGTSSNQTVDGTGMAGSNHCILDRCSTGWSMDESFSSRGAHNITLQRALISEPLNVAGHGNYPPGSEHGFAATVGGDVGSLHHNLIAHAEGRSWSMGGGVDGAGSFAGRLDMRNNVVYNFGRRVTDGGAMAVNFVNNTYKPGPASAEANRTFALRAQYEDQMPGRQQYYCEGNAMPGVFGAEAAQYMPPDGEHDGNGEGADGVVVPCWADVTIDPPPTYRKFHDEPFFASHVDTQSSVDAFKRVLSDVGVSRPVVDDQDARVRGETLAGNHTYVGSVSGKPGLIDDPADVGGLEDFPEVVRDAAAWDADGDGVADWWDGSTGGDGYEVIEGYLNFMADPHALVEPDGSVVVDLAVLLFAGFEDEPTFTVEGGEKGVVEVNGRDATYSAGDEAGIDYVEFTVADAEGSTWTRIFGIAIFPGASEVR